MKDIKVKAKLDILDLIISTLHDHEETLSELIGNLNIAVQKLNETLDRLNKRNETLLRYYEKL